METGQEETVGIKARSVLWYLTFFGFAINYIVRINASITIVDMIDRNYKRAASNRTIITSECIAAINLTQTSELDSEFDSEQSSKYVSLERRLLDYYEVI